MSGWDVVNEAISDSLPKTYRDKSEGSPWFEAFGGPRYIRAAFEHARAAADAHDPTVKLYYNDYNVAFAEKRKKIIAMIRELRAAGVRIDGVGMQGHWTLETPTVEEIDAAAAGNKAIPAGLSDEEQRAYERLAFFYTQVYYAFHMGTRPQTLVGLADSPVGLATFMIDHDARSLQMIARSFNGVPEGLTPDDVLDNITLFWLTNTGVSSARLYWENKLPFFAVKGVKVPVGVSTFADEIYRAPRSWAEQAYPNLVSYNRHDRGGHFAPGRQRQRRGHRRTDGGGAGVGQRDSPPRWPPARHRQGDGPRGGGQPPEHRR